MNYQYPDIEDSEMNEVINSAAHHYILYLQDFIASQPNITSQVEEAQRELYVITKVWKQSNEI